MHCGGLYDYLEDRLAFTLTRRLLQHVAPGGRLILANFAPWTRKWRTLNCRPRNLQSELDSSDSCSSSPQLNLFRGSLVIGRSSCGANFSQQHTGAGRDGRLLGESDLPAIARLFVRLGGRVVVAAQCQSGFRRHYAAFVWCLDEFAKVLINLLEHLRDFGVRLDS